MSKKDEDTQKKGNWKPDENLSMVIRKSDDWKPDPKLRMKLQEGYTEEKKCPEK